MSCCGDKRQQFRTQGGAISGVGRGTTAGPGRVTPVTPRVFFEYSGATAVAVTGRVSGARYVFRGPGVRVEVDPRDRRSLAGVPGLREVG